MEQRGAIRVDTVPVRASGRHRPAVLAFGIVVAVVLTLLGLDGYRGTSAEDRATVPDVGRLRSPLSR